MKNIILIISLINIGLTISFWPEKVEVETNNEYFLLPEPYTITFEGEVVYPGVYQFYSSIKLSDAVLFAGGFRETANLETFNKNQIINKNTKVIVSKKQETEPNIINKIYNLNEISKEEIIKLVDVIDGLTLNRAINIIIYRQQNGLFQKLEDLKKVSGIGDVTYEKISKHFKV